MKSNKEVVYDFLRSQANGNGAQSKGLTTQDLSNVLKISRANLSTLLNQLVEEGRVEKTKGRPVFYRLKTRDVKVELSCFNQMIGHQGSLKSVVSFAKANILYPQDCLNALVVGKNGSGKSYYVKLMYQYALDTGVYKSHAPFIKVNFRHYQNDINAAYHRLFGHYNNVFIEANGGMLFLDHIELLPAELIEKLLIVIETNAIEIKQVNYQLDVRIVCGLDQEANSNLFDSIRLKFPMVVNIPSLSSRPIQEKIDLIKHFILQEALGINKQIIVSSTILQAFLLYNCDDNIRQIKNDIKIGLANTYVRDSGHNKQSIICTMSDFPIYVRKGLLKYHRYQDIVDQLVEPGFNYSFEQGNLTITNQNNYQVLDVQKDEDEKQNLSPLDIQKIIQTEMQNEFLSYKNNLFDKITDFTALEKIVDKAIIDFVRDFLSYCEGTMEYSYSESHFYGLCLHLNALLTKNQEHYKIDQTKFSELQVLYDKQYKLALECLQRFNELFSIKISEQEAYFITMFLCETNEHTKKESKPVVLIVMHGTHVASSLALTINQLVKTNNTYAFDLELDEDLNVAYERLSEKMQEIDCGRGIIVIYDMGSIKTMIELISEELMIDVWMIHMPLTLIGLECARKASVSDDGKAIVDSIGRFEIENMSSQYDKKKAVITVCYSGQGGALSMMEYIRRDKSLDDLEIIPLAINDEYEAIDKISNYRITFNVICIVSSFDLHIAGIRYVSISDLFKTDKKDIKNLLFFGKRNKNDLDLDNVFLYLSKSLKYVDVNKMRKPLLSFVDKMEVKYALSYDLKLGLLMHVASTLNNLIGYQTMAIYENCDEIYENNKKDVVFIERALNPIENIFDVFFDRQEVVGILSLCRKV